MKSFCLIFSVILSCLLPRFFLLYAFDLNIYEKEDKIYCGQGFKKYKDGITILHLKGKPLEIGYQFGRLLEHDIVKAYSFWRTELPAYSVKSIPRSRKKHLSPLYLSSQIVDNLESQLPQEYYSELLGSQLALSHELSLKALFSMQCHFDLYQFYDCLSFAAVDSATKYGKIVIGKNIDTFGAGFLDRKKILTFYEPEEGLPFVTFNPVGIAGVIDGMNTNGVVVSFNPIALPEKNLGRELLALDGIPIVFLLRKALQYGTTLEAAVKVITDSPRTRGGAVIIADAQTNKILLVEFTPFEYVIKVADKGKLWSSVRYTTELFVARYYRQLNRSYERRFLTKQQRFQELLNNLTGKIDPLNTALLLRDKNNKNYNDISYLESQVRLVSNMKTVQSIIFMPYNLDFWIPRYGVIPASDNEYLNFNLYDELGLEPEEPVVIENIPASAITQNEKYMGMQKIIRGKIYSEGHDYVKASQVFKKAIEQFSKHKETHIMAMEYLGDALQAEGKYNDALDSYSRLINGLDTIENTIAAREVRVRVNTKKGNIYDLLGLRQQAVVCYNRATSVRDIYSPLWQRKAKQYLKKTYAGKN